MKQLVKEAKRKPATRCYDNLIAICGAGALGGNLAEALARRGFQRLRILDRDWVEEENLGTQPFLPRDIGTPKARTLARTLYDVAQTRVEPVVVELTEDNAPLLLDGSQLVVDAFDNAASRRIVAEACAGLGVPCLHLMVDADGRCGLLCWDEDKPTMGQDGQEDCPLPRTLASLVVDGGSEAIVRFLLTGEKRVGKIPFD